MGRHRRIPTINWTHPDLTHISSDNPTNSPPTLLALSLPNKSISPCSIIWLASLPLWRISQQLTLPWAGHYHLADFTPLRPAGRIQAHTADSTTQAPAQLSCTLCNPLSTPRTLLRYSSSKTPRMPPLSLGKLLVHRARRGRSLDPWILPPVCSSAT